MGIREHTTFTVECDCCGLVLRTDMSTTIQFYTQRYAHEFAVKWGWTDDTTATKCPDCVGVITREEPWWAK